jgi:hypothetical protein
METDMAKIFDMTQKPLDLDLDDYEYDDIDIDMADDLDPDAVIDAAEQRRHEITFHLAYEQGFADGWSAGLLKLAGILLIAGSTVLSLALLVAAFTASFPQPYVIAVAITAMVAGIYAGALGEQQ